MKKLALVLAHAGLVLSTVGCGGGSDAPPPVGPSSPGAAPKSVAGLGSAAPPSGSASPGAPASSRDPGVDPVFAADPVLRRDETYAYRRSEPGDHSLPAGTFTLRYNVATAGGSPLKARLETAS